MWPFPTLRAAGKGGLASWQLGLPINEMQAKKRNQIIKNLIK